MSQPQLTTHYGVPLLHCKLPNAEPLNRDLERYFRELESQGDKHRKPDTLTHQIEIFESNFDLFKYKEPCIQKLKSFCLHNIWQTVMMLNNYNVEEMQSLRVFTDAWFHMTRYGGYIGSHQHPMASWSAVYMVDPGDTAEDVTKGGELTFGNPRPHCGMYLDPGNAYLSAPFENSNLVFAMKPGEMLIFPSYMVHHVSPYYGKRPRITVAMNCSFAKTEKQATGQG